MKPGSCSSNTPSLGWFPFHYHAGATINKRSKTTTRNNTELLLGQFAACPGWFLDWDSDSLRFKASASNGGKPRTLQKRKQREKGHCSQNADSNPNHEKQHPCALSQVVKLVQDRGNIGDYLGLGALRDLRCGLEVTEVTYPQAHRHLREPRAIPAPRCCGFCRRPETGLGPGRGPKIEELDPNRLVSLWLPLKTRRRGPPKKDTPTCPRKQGENQRKTCLQ